VSIPARPTVNRFTLSFLLMLREHKPRKVAGP
jgi:hypothetical protein